MVTNNAMVARIRPMSWKVFVAGKDSADYVREKLHASGMNCTDPVREPELQEPAIFSFIATPKVETPLTAMELQAILNQDGKIEVAFDT
ncbi:MAG: hypothetical protein JXM70_24660 [Pirellulales bacterium]|nr:hypothetical protein [Pirellulales bacterium]